MHQVTSIAAAASANDNLGWEGAAVQTAETPLEVVGGTAIASSSAARAAGEPAADSDTSFAASPATSDVSRLELRVSLLQ